MVYSKHRILIDLDGVLNEYGKEKFDKNYIPIAKDGAKDFIKKLNKNFELYLFTTRDIKLSSKWLIQNGLYDYFEGITNKKLPAFLYIDDRAICFKGDFKKTLAEIKNFQTYWKSS